MLFRVHQSHVLDFVGQLGVGRSHFVTNGDGAAENLQEGDHASVIIVPTVEEEGLQLPVGVAGRGRHTFNNRAEQLVDVYSGLAGDEDHVLTLEIKQGFHLSHGALHLCGREVDLVDDGDNGELAAATGPKVKPSSNGCSGSGSAARTSFSKAK
jgi:hypothetical protein